MRSCGIALGIIGGILSLIASITVIYIIAQGYGWPHGSSSWITVKINCYISFFVILVSLSNVNCNKVSSGLIIILFSSSFFIADKFVSACLAISFIGAILACISLIKNNDKNSQSANNKGTNKNENDSEKRIVTNDSDHIANIISNYGILTGLLGILASAILGHLLSENVGTGLYFLLLLIIFSIINLFCNKFASAVIIALSCFGFLYADNLVGACFIISFIAAVSTYIPQKNGQNTMIDYNKEMNKQSHQTENSN